MSTVDLDRRAREAGTAARASVAPVAARATPPAAGRAGGPRLVLAGGAVAVVTAVALVSLGDDVTRLSTTPAGQGAPATSQPPGTPASRSTPPLAGPVEAPLATGTTDDGRAWQLFLGGPSSDLCLGVDVREPSALGGAGVCAGAPFGGRAADPHRPAHFDDLRAPAFAFGRADAGVSRVSVVLASGATLGPEPVIEAEGGPYYVVELPDHSPPLAVLGHRADGSTVRHDR